MIYLVIMAIASNPAPEDVWKTVYVQPTESIDECRIAAGDAFNVHSSVISSYLGRGMMLVADCVEGDTRQPDASYFKHGPPGVG